MKKIDIRDVNESEVFFGDKFIAKIIRPSLVRGTLVTVVEDVSDENLDCGRNYDLEDQDGNRLWNAWTVIRGGEKQ